MAVASIISVCIITDAVAIIVRVFCAVAWELVNSVCDTVVVVVVVRAIADTITISIGLLGS